MTTRSLYAAVALLATLLLPTACSAGGTMRGLASQVAALAADPQTFRVTPATVIEKLRLIVTLKADAPTEAEWTFSGAAPAAGVAWARVYFQQAAKVGQWEFLQLRLGLDPPQADRSSFYNALADEITKRLGKPKAPPSGKAERLRSWSLGKQRLIALRDGTFENPIDDTKGLAVLVEMATAQGEAD